MKHYDSFSFSGYYWNHHAGKITLRYGFSKDLQFEELLKLPEPVSDERLKDHEWQIERLLRALHIIGGISYYKAFIPKKMHFGEDAGLSAHDHQFWTTVYEKGLGEFFFQNQIDFRGLINFPKGKVEKSATRKPLPATRSERILVPIGGGKDSIVTAKLLKEAGKNVTLFRMNADPKIDELAHQLGLPLISVKRSLDPTLFQLNENGALNGHIPITAYVSILACLLAELYDFDAVALSNEQSASYGNTEYLGAEINHQWSKSLEFEKMFRRFLEESIETNVEYMSLLRPLSELRIVEIFSTWPEFFETATSCNKNWSIAPSPTPPPRTGEGRRGGGLWCGDCPKCAFVFACLAAFVDRETLEKSFGGNFFDDESQLDLYRELLGIKDIKPFECVGTPEETKAAFLLARKRGELMDTAAMKMFEKEVLPSIENPEELINTVMSHSSKHCLSDELQRLLPANR